MSIDIHVPIKIIITATNTSITTTKIPIQILKEKQINRCHACLLLAYNNTKLTLAGLEYGIISPDWLIMTP